MKPRPRTAVEIKPQQMWIWQEKTVLTAKLHGRVRSFRRPARVVANASFSAMALPLRLMSEEQTRLEMHTPEPSPPAQVRHTHENAELIFSLLMRLDYTITVQRRTAPHAARRTCTTGAQTSSATRETSE